MKSIVIIFLAARALTVFSHGQTPVE